MGVPNFSNQTIWTGDNLAIMRGMNSECIDLIYLDPPFNSNTNYAAPIGSQAAGAEFKDTWTLQDVDIAWLDLIEAKHPRLNKVINAALTSSDRSYLIYMAVRLLEMHRLLKPTGSIYLHCDPTMSHWLKLLLDCIFGKKQFRNEIVWHYRTYVGQAKEYYPKKHDVLFWYSKDESFYRKRNPFQLSYLDNFQDTVDFKRWRKFYIGNEIRYGSHPKTDSRFTAYLDRWIKENRRTPDEGEVIYKCNGWVIDDVWQDIQAIDPKDRKQKTGFKTQKPLALLNRIIQDSCVRGGVVLDPFCGCATTLVAADSLQRQWVGIDISPTAVRLVRERLRDGSTEGVHKDQWRSVIARTDVPKRTDMDIILPYNHKDNKRSLFALQEGVCNGCSEHYRFKDFHVDHIIDRKSGGTDHLSNLQLLCGHCNSVKGDRGMEYLIAKLAA